MSAENAFRQKYTRISGLSAIRRLPRLGKIRLGIKVEYGANVPTVDKNGKPKWEKKTRPKETDYFVCPAEIKKVYGDEPKELNISFPMNDPEVIFPQCYKWYGSSAGLKCRGDGETALRLNEDTKEMEERECPCELLEEGKCQQRASLVFMMPGIKIGGVYQIDLSSYHSIVDINSGIDYARALLGDQIAFVPFKLKRVPKETHNDGKKQIHFTLQLELDITSEQLTELQNGQRLFAGQRRRYEIEAPKEDKNPTYDSKEDGAVIEEDDGFDEDTYRKIEERVGEEGLKEIQESKVKEAELKKAREAGKTSLRTPAEIKKVLEKKEALLAEIVKVAKENNVNTWREIVDIGERYKIFPAGLVASQVKTIVVDHPDKLRALIEAIKTDQVITDEDIPDEKDGSEDFINADGMPE